MPKYSVTLAKTKPNDPIELIKATVHGKSEKVVFPAEDEVQKSTTEEIPNPSCLQKAMSWRWMTAIITSLGVVFLTILRNCMSMALVCMTGGSHVNTTLSENMSYANSSNYLLPGEFDWDNETQGIILSAAFYSSFIAPAISGFVAKRFGAKVVVGVSVAASGIATLLTPVAARGHVNVLIAVRVFLGFFAGTIFPASLELWSHWAPAPERVQLVSSTYTGINVGSLVSSLLSGFLCTIPHDNGWPYVFYVFGGLSMLWCVAWCVCVYDTPQSHPYISAGERAYIVKHTHKTDDTDTSTRPPFRAMLLSGPVWAYVIVQTCHMWCSSIFFAYLPKYMSDVLHYPVEQNAVLSSAPFATRFVGVIAWGYLSDLLLRKSSLSVTWIRKVVQSSGFLICGVFTVGIGFVTEDDKEIAVTLFLLAMFCQSSSMSSSSVTPLDIAPRYAGIITGGYIVVGCFVSMFGPMAAAYLTPNGTLEEWRIVFLIIAAVYVVGVTAYVVMGSGELQPWATPSTETRMDHPQPEVMSDKDGNAGNNVQGRCSKTAADNESVEFKDIDLAESKPETRDPRDGIAHFTVTTKF